MPAWLILSPFLAWIIAGSVKFLANAIQEKRWTIDLIGYGGWPSNHSCIVSTLATVVYWNSGLHSSSFLIAIGFAFVVIMDAMGLRRQIGKQADAINQLDSRAQLRSRMGHTSLEVLSGLVLGILCGSFFWWVS